MIENKLYNMNCEELMSMISDNYVDLTITSPPYDDIRSYNGYSFDYKPIIDDLYRITKNGGVVVWIVADQTIKGSETMSSFKQALYFREIGFNLHDTMIYHKENPVPVGGSNRYYQSFEYMFVFSKGKPKTFNPLMRERKNKYNDKRTERINYMNRDKDGNFTKKKHINLTGKVKLNNTWSYVVGGGNSVDYGIKHPAAFPKQMCIDHILSWTNEGDIVFDPMVGSGTTIFASIETNRQCISSEISTEYCEYINLKLRELNNE